MANEILQHLFGYVFEFEVGAVHHTVPRRTKDGLSSVHICQKRPAVRVGSDGARCQSLREF